MPAPQLVSHEEFPAVSVYSASTRLGSLPETAGCPEPAVAFCGVPIVPFVFYGVAETARPAIPHFAYPAPDTVTPNSLAPDAPPMPSTGNPKTGVPGGARANAESGEYPLTPLQEGMLFQWQIDRHSGTDIEQIVGDLHEAIDSERLNAAWQQAAASYSTLRTAFRWEGLASPVQRVQPSVVVPFATQDLRAASRDDAELRIAAFIEADRREGFDLANAPAMRVTLFQLDSTHFRIVWTVHHILIDGRSFEVVLNFVFDAYEGKRALTVDRPYADYVQWTERQEHHDSKQFWKQKLAGFSAPTPLPIDVAPSGGSASYQLRWVKVARDASQRLRDVAEREGLTLNTLIIGAWGLMLSRYSGEQDILFGATKTTRRGTIPDADSTLGVFLATIPVRLTVHPDMTVIQWLKHVREEWASLRGFEHLPLVEIRQASEVRTPRLFDTLFVFENYQFGTRLQQQGGSWSHRHFGILEQTGFPLTLAAYGDAEIALKIQFDRTRFSSELIDRMTGHLVTLLEKWTGDTSVTVGRTSMMTAAERQTVVHEWNQTATEYPRERLIHELFEAQVAERANEVAVQCDGVSLTYSELNARANRLAYHLEQHGVREGDCVGLCAERSLAHLTASLAILKTGAAYLSLEPGYPADRLSFMMDDANVRIVLAPAHLLAQAATLVAGTKSEKTVLDISGGDDRVPEHAHRTTFRTTDSGNHVAYVMYTSGSSGTPKGVTVTHRGVVRLVRNTNYMTFTHRDVMLGMATTMFDASTWETWTALLNGGRLVLMPAGPLDLVQLNNLVANEQVTAMLYSVALFQQVVDLGLEQYSSVRQFLVGGDVAPLPHLRKAMDALPHCQFVNAYGPTENAVITCAFPLVRGALFTEPLPIGPPIANTQAYVLDASGTPVEIGVPGELCTGGDGVALGYLNREELTRDRFITDTFTGAPGGRVYRTGDGARWRADGVVEFLGRLDNQVKIRGFRIEPGEVESVMSTLPGVRAAAIAVRKDASGQKRLLGYFVVEAGKTLSAADVRAALRAQLPDYMVPASIMALDELPLTNSGKIDRKALPEPGELDVANNETNWKSRPLGRSQMQLAGIWEELLGRSGVGIDDDFFEMGGHSLLAVRMMNEVERILGRRLPLTVLLEKPTIRFLAKKIDAAILADPEPEMVVLNADGRETPLVFVHGDLTGGGWYCRRLATILGESVPMIVMPTFRPPASGESWTVETMAAMHVRELKKVRPHGPYRIGGFCAGGLIALEIARELKKSGDIVEGLAMVDSVNYNAPIMRWRPVMRRLYSSAPDGNDFTARQRVVSRVKYYDLRLRAVLAMSPGQLARWATNAVRIRLPGARANTSAALPIEEKSEPRVAKNRPERENLLFYARAQSVFVPQKYDGLVDMIFSSDPTDQATNASDPAAAAEALKAGSADVERGWRSVVPQAKIRRIAGSHIGMIVDNLDQLGRSLRSCFNVTDD